MKKIDKMAWLYIKDRKALFARSKGQELFYSPGGKREEGESKEQTLIREIKEELSVDLIPETIKHVKTFSGPAHGEREDIFLKLTFFEADFNGELEPSSEIEEVSWLSSKDADKTTVMGESILSWMKKSDLID